MKTRQALGVILLGAGASSRMGRSKLLLPWGDTSIVGQLIQQWQALAAEQITVVCRPADKLLAAELDRLHFPAQDRIENPEPERGMFSSILCAAHWNGWISNLTAWAIVLGDQPHLQLDTLRRLLEFQRAHPDAICQPAFGGRVRHPVLLSRQAFANLQQSNAETLKDFLRHPHSPTAECPLDDAGLALDLDRPEDYAKVSQRQ